MSDRGAQIALRVLFVVVLVVTLLVALLELWRWLLAAVVVCAAWRHLTRGMRRRRPKSSWSSLLRSAAVVYAAWNSRWLRPKGPGAHIKVTVPKRAVTTFDDQGVPY